MIASGIYNLLTTAPSLVGLIAPKGVYYTLAAKEAPRPYVVFHIITAPPAAVALEGSSAQILGRIQLDYYADDQFTARKVAKACKLLLQDFNGALSDGTILQVLELGVDMDDAYEIGGEGQVFRVVHDYSVFYNEGA